MVKYVCLLFCGADKSAGRDLTSNKLQYLSFKKCQLTSLKPFLDHSTTPLFWALKKSLYNFLTENGQGKVLIVNACGTLTPLGQPLTYLEVV